MTISRITRRSALKVAAASLTVPFIYRLHSATAAPSETLLHAAIGAGGMGASDIGSLTKSKHLKLVAIADVDTKAIAAMKQKFPDVKVYADWRELLDKEKQIDSVSVSTPDHMHACPTMRAIRMGKHVYTQKPLTQTIYEARKLTEAAREKKIVSQMGIQIHSHPVHRTVVATVQAGAIGKVKEVHSWSGKMWGDLAVRPDRHDQVPENFNWDLWLGVAADRPFIGNCYYHPGNWRKRLDFGTGTFGDMGCHILDPVFGSLGVKDLKSVQSEGNAPNATNWGLHAQVKYTFPGSEFTAETVTVTWYDGNRRPPDEITKLIVPHKLSDQGSIYIGEKGVMYSPYIGMPILLPEDQFKSYKLPEPGGADHYLQWVDAARGIGKASAPFDYAGPLTEMVLLGCLSTRFPKTKLEWDPIKLKVTNVEEANKFVRRINRNGWDEEGF